MTWLAVDTATDEASIALVNSGAILWEVSWSAAGNHSRHLPAVLKGGLEVAGVSVENLTALCVAVGPGSFNGVRVGMSFVHGIALARSLPVYGISSLDVIGLQCSALDDFVAALLPAGRGEVYRALYTGGWGDFRLVGEYERLPIEEAATDLPGSCVPAGPGSDLVVAAAAGSRPDLRPAPRILGRRRAGFLAELGRRAAENGRSGDPHVLEPLYLRVSAAEEKRVQGVPKTQ